MNRPIRERWILLALVLGGLVLFAFLWDERQTRSLEPEGALDAEVETTSSASPRRAEPTASSSVSEDGAGSGSVLTETADEGASIEVRVSDGVGQAVAGADLLYCVARRAGEPSVPSKKAQTDEQGRGRFEHRGSGFVLASRDGRLPVIAEVESPGRIEIELPDGETLRGRVTLDGKLPGEEMELGLVLVTPDEYSAMAMLERVPDLSTQRSLRHGSITTDAATGRFEIKGLPSGWVLDFILPRPLTDRKRGFSPQVSSSGIDGQELHLDLVVQPHVKGRLVDAELMPVSGVHVEFWCRQYQSGPMGRADTAEDGRFSFLYGPDWQTPERLVFNASGLVWPLAIDTQGEKVLDLGDLRLPPARSIAVAVRDRDTQAPLAHAVLGILGSADLSRADSSGALTILAPPEAMEFEVAAPRYEVKRVLVPAHQPEPLTIDLEPAASLVVSCVDEDDQPIGGAMVYASGAEDLVADSSLLRLQVLNTTFESDSSTSFGRDPKNVSGYADSEGKIELWGIGAGKLFELGCRVPGIPGLARIQGLTLNPGERRQVTLKAEGPLETLLIEVRDTRGEALPGATVRVFPATTPNGYLERTSDAAGRVRIRALAPVKTRVVVLKEGFKTFEGEVLPGSREDAFDVVLQKAALITMRFQNARAEVVDPDDCFPPGPGRSQKVRRLAPGQFSVEAISDEPFHLEVVVGLSSQQIKVDLEKGTSQTFTLEDTIPVEIVITDRTHESEDLMFRIRLESGATNGLPIGPDGRIHTRLLRGRYHWWVEPVDARLQSPSPVTRELRIESSDPIRLAYP